MLEVRLLGQFDVRLRGQAIEIPSRPAQALFAYLLLNPGITHRRELLAGLLWPDASETNARSYLRHALWRINQALGNSYLNVNKISIAYAQGTEYWLDAALLNRPLIKGMPAENLIEEISTYEGDLLPGFYDEWIIRERDRLYSMFERKMDVLLSSLVQERRWRAIIEWGERWIALGQTPEPAYRALMVAHSGLGNRAAVVAAYERCVESLREEVGVEPCELTRTTYEQLLSDPASSSEDSNVRVQARRAAADLESSRTTPFIGRKKELAEIAQCLRDPSCRLLTLIGPGGIGKTRLALETADQLHSNTCFVSLASIDSSLSLVQVIAESLGLSSYGAQEPKARLLNSLQEKKNITLILDNFEHLLEGAGLVSDILQSSPSLKVLATSRERLNLQGEWVYEVQGMDVPQNSNSSEIERFSSVELFLQSARRFDPGFALLDKQRSHIARICQLIEGMPLAIELAAAWIRVLSPQEIADELEQSLDLLSSSLRDVPARHQSLRAVFDHSWNLLSETEKQIFERLSIFRGGFTREAAREVAGASLHTLSSLADKSLLRWSPSGRYHIHNSLSQYGRELLGDHSNESCDLADLHCGFYLGFIQGRYEDFNAGKQKEALQTIEDEIDNVRVAWRWAIAHLQAERIARALDGLYTFYLARGWFQEGEIVLCDAIEQMRALEQQGSDRTTRLTLAKALARHASLCTNLGRYDAAKRQLSEALAMLRELGAEEEIAFVLNLLGTVAWDLGEYGEAMQYHQESAAICRSIDCQHELLVSLDNLGFIYMSLGQIAEAENLILESVGIARAIGDRMGTASPLGRLGWVTYVNGELERACACFEEAIGISKEFNNRMVMSLDQAGLSVTLNALGEHKEAKDLACESLTIARDIGYPLAIVTALGSLGDAERTEGNYPQAHECLSEGFQIALRLRLFPMYLLLLIVLGSLLADEGEDEQATEVLAMVLRSARNVAAFARVAEPRLAELQEKLPSNIYEEAKRRGEKANLEGFVQAITESDMGRAA